tara:strand:- start:439 stop:678 length:240 start_codon:yes stop_codon:yes gene_type:complete
MRTSIIITVLVKNIVWDTDSHEDIIENNLPEQVPVQVDLASIHSFDCINHQICEYLSEEYGWLISGYDLEGYSNPVQNQ